MWIPRIRVAQFLVFWKVSICFPKDLEQLAFPSAENNGLFFPTPTLILVVFVVCDVHHTQCYKMVSYFYFIFIWLPVWFLFLWWKEMQSIFYIFILLLVICMSFSENFYVRNSFSPTFCCFYLLVKLYRYLLSLTYH